MKKHLTLFVAIIIMAMFSTTNAFCQKKGSSSQKKVVELKATKVTATRGDNPNIKSDRPTEDTPEPKSRGQAACGVYFNNYTGYYVNIYVDGYFRGTVSPYGGGTVVVGSGYTTIYCQTTGGTFEWTAGGDCRNSYEFRLSAATAD